MNREQVPRTLRKSFQSKITKRQLITRWPNLVLRYGTGTGDGFVVGLEQLLGGLNTLNQLLLDWVGSGLKQEVLLILSFTLIGAVVNLPLSWYQTFVIESQFGFNKSTIKLWLTDML
jgi:hypothetical protein